MTVAARDQPGGAALAGVQAAGEQPLATLAAGEQPLATLAAGEQPLATLADLVERGEVLVLTGAGISTESGIPDYRGPTGRARRAEPMTFQEFTGSAAARQRYWARSHLGWRHIAGAPPNAGHRAVAEFDRRGLLAGIITQNVDGLHQAAGARNVTELHGSLGRVMCLRCGERTARADLDRRMRAANPGWDTQVIERGAPRSECVGHAAALPPSAPPSERVGHAAALPLSAPPSERVGHAAALPLRPDGDAVVGEESVARFRVMDCLACGGLLKPDVVFFGENVPPPRVAACHDLVARAAVLLVLGSSLTVMSGYRFVRQAARLSIPVVIINHGPTRGDGHALLRIDAPLGRTLTGLVARLGAR